MARASAYITIRCPAHKTAVRGLMGTDVPRITGGYGGWRQLDKPRKRGTLEYEGIEPLEMQLELILDAWGEESRVTNVDTDLVELEAMTVPVDLNQPPPTVFVDGKAIPRDKSTPWVITAITWGTTIRNTEGETKRQTFQMTLVQADAIEHARTAPKPTRARNPRSPSNTRPRTYTWKKKDTWPQVALKLLGDKKLAIKIIDYNKFRPGHQMKVGQKIKVPRAPAN
jgi:hypothetical protein